jgi:hypothetical protein
MNSCPVFPVAGTVTAVEPGGLDKGGILSRCIDIYATGGRARLTIVRAVETLAGAIRAYVEQRGGRA